MDTLESTAIPLRERDIYYTREFGRILVEKPLEVFEEVLKLPFVFRMYKDPRKRVIVITRRVEVLNQPGRLNHKIVDIKSRVFGDFSENEVEDVLAAIRRGLA